ncbi:uncharacterized protein LOC144638138 [Oculina patagonica]
MMAANLALLIGPSYASDLPTYCGPLEGVENDLQLMKGMLCRNGFPLENIKVLEGQMATRENILSSLGEVSCQAETGSVVVIHFSGHGYELTDACDQGLIPATLTKEMVDEYHIYDTCITGEHLKPYLLKLNQKGALVNTIFDCCYSGRMYRGFSETDTSTTTRAIRQLALSDEYINEHRQILKTRSPIKEPVEQEDKPIEHAPVQDTQPPNPMYPIVLLHHPVPEFWTPMLKSQGWSPTQNDKFIHIAACGTTERAYEWLDPETNKIYGHLTSALVEVIDALRPEDKKISYNALECLIKQKFAERNYQQQTPQFEGGNMNLVLFGFETVAQPPKSFEIVESKMLERFTSKVVLNGGWLQGVVDGEYDVFDPTLTDDMVGLDEVGGHWLGRIDITLDDIKMIKSDGTVLFSHEEGLKVGCKARLCRKGSMYYPVYIAAAVDDPEVFNQINYTLENQQMFSIEEKETPDCTKLDIVEVEGKPCWRATRDGKMILPYQQTGDEHLMAKNMAKYFRVKFARNPRPPDLDMLRNVSFKVFKVENVPNFRNDPDKKTELKAQAVETDDLFGGGPPYAIPTFQAHKVECVTTSYHRQRYKAVDGTGDALVIQVINNEIFPIHICVMSYQADGSIVVLYPPKNGVTEVLKPGESAVEIRRILLHPDTVRRMVEPDFKVERPDGCNDTLMLYATTEQTDYEPLFQTAIELSPHLSTRGIFTPDGLRLATVSQFRDALEPQPAEKKDYVRGNLKWLTIKREIRVLYHQDEDPAP